MRLGNLANLHRQMVDALGEHHRRTTARLVVAERHGVVRRVGDDHVGIRHRDEHAALAHALLDATDLALDLGVAVGFLLLFTHLLPRHLELAHVVPLLERHIDTRNERQRHGKTQEHERHELQCLDDTGARLEQAERDIAIEQQIEQVRGDAEEQQRLAERLDEFHERLHAEDAREALERIELVELRCHGRGTERPATHDDRSDQRGNEHQDEEGCQHQQRRHHVAREGVEDGRRIEGFAPFDDEVAAHEIEKVTEGEGRRIDSYLQLKVTDSEVVRGKILIDSPGFDADQQRTSTLKLTNHIMDISDLVLVFFDARHPEPGSMQDTLTHLVEQTISRNDSNKFVFILNQIDTAAREDNTEEIVGAWQRALSQKGLTAGRFYTIYNKAVAPTIEDEGKRRRFEEKRDHDMAEIEDRIRQVEVERAYRIVGQMEKRAYHLRDTAMPALAEYKRRWAQRIVRTDLVLLAILAVLVLGVAIATGAIGSLGSLLLSIVADPVAMGGTILGLAAVLLGGHFLVKNLVGKLMLHGIRKGDDASLARAFAMNTRWFRSIFNRQPVGWNNRAKKQINGVIEGASRFVQSLNDQFTNPSGQVREADQTGRKTT